MKKVLSILILTFLISGTVFAKTVVVESCGEYAEAAVIAEEDAYGAINSMNEYWNVHRFYYTLCRDAGGADNMLDPVCL